MPVRDVIVIGAGAVGCCVAHRIATRKQRVLLLDTGMPGRRASGAAAGVLGAQCTATGPGPLFDLAMRSLSLYPGLADELRVATGVDVAFRRTGVLELAFDPAEDTAIATRMQWQLARDLPVERLDASARDLLEPDVSPEIVAAYHYPADAQVDPRWLVAALTQAQVTAGAEIRAGASVQRIVSDGGHVRGVESNGELIEAGAVVVCAGAWSSRIEGAGVAASAVMAVRGQAIELEQHPSPIRAVITSRRGTVVPRLDGRLFCVSTTEHAVEDDSPTVDGMLQILEGARAMIPAIAQAQLLDAWGALRPATADGLPLLGRGHVAGLYFAIPHDFGGILLAPAMAEAIASLVLDGKSAIDLAQWSPTRFVS